MDKLINMESNVKKLMGMVDDVLRTGDQLLKEVHLLQEFVNNAPVEVPDEIKSIVNDAATAIEARSEKLREYLTNPESEVHMSDLILTDVLDGLLQRARDFVTGVGKAEDDDSTSDEDMKSLERSIKMNKEQLEKVHETLDVVRKFGCPSVDDPDKFIDTLEKLVVALQSRGDDLEMCKSLPVEQWPDSESMTPYFMDIIKAAGPELGMAMAEALCIPDFAELAAENSDEDKEKCKIVEVKVCDGQLKVVTEGFTPEEHGRIERFFAREFDYPLELDEQEADGIFAEADKEHLSRIKSFFARECDIHPTPNDAVADMEEELADYMNKAKSVKVPYVVDGTKYAVDIPLDTALNYWKSRGTDGGLFNLIGIIDLTRQIHNDIYGEYIPLSDKFKLDSEFVKCEGVYKLIYDMNK